MVAEVKMNSPKEISSNQESETKVMEKEGNDKELVFYTQTEVLLSVDTKEDLQKEFRR